MKVSPGRKPTSPLMKAGVPKLTRGKNLETTSTPSEKARERGGRQMAASAMYAEAKGILHVRVHRPRVLMARRPALTSVTDAMAKAIERTPAPRQTHISREMEKGGLLKKEERRKEKDGTPKAEEKEEKAAKAGREAKAASPVPTA